VRLNAEATYLCAWHL